MSQLPWPWICMNIVRRTRNASSWIPAFGRSVTSDKLRILCLNSWFRAVGDFIIDFLSRVLISHSGSERNSPANRCKCRPTKATTARRPHEMLADSVQMKTHSCSSAFPGDHTVENDFDY